MTTPDHERMYLFRADPLAEAESPGEVWEYKVVADTDVIGEIQHGPFFFTIWELSFDTRPGTERALCLRVRQPYRESPESYWDAASPNGYYHGGGIAEEVVTLASLFLRRRLRVEGVVRMGDLPRMYNQRRSTRAIDQELLNGPTNLESLASWFQMLEHFNSALHQRFILAANFYQQALQRADEDPTTAYLHLVSAIEVLSGDFDIGPVNIADYDQGLSTLIDRIEDAALGVAITEGVLRNQHFIGRRFKEFILHHLEETFWREQDSDHILTITRSDLPKLLTRIYNQRSKTLHEGEPFPPSTNYAPHRGEEMPIGLGEMSGDRRWEPSQFIPLFHFFERLTRHVLLSYLRANSRNEQDELDVAAE